jgi:glucoamylase
MPRDLPIGNGSLLVAFDHNYQIRDLYFPRVGQENQTDGRPFRLGVWADGNFSWVGPDWIRSLDYHPNTLVTAVRLESTALNLTLEIEDTVDFHVNALIRRVHVVNPEERERDVRLFFHHEFHISGSDVGDSCYYDPDTRALIHYKGQRWFLACGSVGDRIGAGEWACGKRQPDGSSGTFRDAEDGELSGNPVAQGAVDSVVGFRAPVGPRGTSRVSYWLAAGFNYPDVVQIHRSICEKGPDAILARTASYWRLWCSNEAMDFLDLSPEAARHFRRSLLLVRTQIDNGGAIIAANDSDITLMSHDTYSYMWARDGALACHALARSGVFQPVRRFFHFCNQAITPDGYMMHKYNPDGSVASSWHSWFRDGRKRLPIQEDETALLLWMLHRYFEIVRDVEFLKPFYRPLIISAGEFLEQYRDPETRLPLPSYDLWEERYGVHTWTVSAVAAGLRAAAAFAREFGEEAHAARFGNAAREVAEGLRQYFWHEEQGRFARMGTRTESGYQLDMTIDASLAGLFKFVYSANDPRVVSTMTQVRDRLRVQTDVGGWARYQNDYYQQVEKQDVERVPGNPWFICGFWVAEWLIARAAHDEDLAEARSIIERSVRRALPSGVMAEQIHPYTGEPLSVSPLTWSHASFVNCVLDYVEKARRLNVCRTCGQSVTVPVVPAPGPAVGSLDRAS